MPSPALVSGAPSPELVIWPARVSTPSLAHRPGLGNAAGVDCAGEGEVIGAGHHYVLRAVEEDRIVDHARAAIGKDRHVGFGGRFGFRW